MRAPIVQFTEPRSASANDDGNQQTFWGQMELLAMRGMDKPETLTHAEISRMFRMAFVAMARKGSRRSSWHPSSSQT